MRIIIVPLAIVMAILLFNTHAQDFNKLHFSDCGSKSAVIEKVDITPMPILNPSEAFFTFIVDLKRPVTKIQVTLDILRSVSGISLPVRCYLVNGNYVGSCTYADLCDFLQSLLPEFQPETCPIDLLEYEIDCTCPFKIQPRKLNIVNHSTQIPDASTSAASFMASGNFNITVTVNENDPTAPKPYGCGKIAFTVKQKK